MILRSTTWFIRWLGLRTFFSLILLTIALGSIAWALNDTVRGLDFGLLLVLATSAVLLGWGLAAAKPLPGWLAASLIAIIGAEAVVIKAAGLSRIVDNVGQSLFSWLWYFWQAPFNVNPAAAPLTLHTTDFGLAVGILLTRFTGWLTTLVAGEPASDPVVNAITWSLAFWAVSAWAAWGIRRSEKPLLAMVPAGILLATTVAFSRSQVDMLLPLLAVTLLLMAITGHHSRERSWEANQVDFAPDVRLDITMAVIPIVLALVVLAGSAPSVSIKEVSRSVKQLLSGKIARVEPVLGLSRRARDQEDTLETVRSPGLPRRHLLGSGPELSEQVALIVSLEVPSTTLDGPVPGRPTARLYWRSLTYDTYSGRGWYTRRTEKMDYDAGEVITSAPVPARQLLRQNVQIVSNQSNLLYAAGDLITADHDFTIDWRGPDDSFAATIPVTNYRVDGLVPAASITELRQAGTDYPDWIIKRYLNLPDKVPDRVISLAHEVTATAPTPFDRAKAIESYLRTFPYSLELPEPPLDQDMVDYFLFDLQRGYCDYYSTSMVVIARAAGIPARLAVGYAAGTYDPVNDRYVVTEADAHSWAEIYFPEIGWLEFEPTAAQPQSQRPDEPVLAGQPHAFPALEPATAQDTGLGRWWWLLLPGGIALVAAAGTLWSLLDRWRLYRLPPSSTIATLYDRLQHRGQQLTVSAWLGATPYEFVAEITDHVEALAREWRWGTLLAPAPGELHWLTHLYVKTSFSTHQPDSTDQAEAIRTWQRLKRRLILARLSDIATRLRQRQQ